MVTNFFPALHALRAKLDEFYRIYRQGGGEDLLRPVVNQLQDALNAVNAFLVGEDAWTSLSDERRWGYLLLHSLAETVRDEIKNL
jgi:hypothetical protein